MAKSAFLIKIDSIDKPNDVPLIPIEYIKKNTKRVHRMFMICINLSIMDYLLILGYQVDHFGKRSTFLSKGTQEISPVAASRI